MWSRKMLCFLRVPVQGDKKCKEAVGKIDIGLPNAQLSYGNIDVGFDNLEEALGNSDMELDNLEEALTPTSQ